MSMDHSVEVVRLRATIRDLLALSAIPEVWVGREPPALATELADLLIESLRLDFAFVRLCDPEMRQTVEAIRGDAWNTFPEWLQERLAVSGQIPHKEIVNQIRGGDESCCGIVIPIGVNGERGLVAAACYRSDFPNQIDQQLLSVAANSAATAFRSAHLINELRNAQKVLRDREQELRTARDELEIRVAERTSELQRSAQELQRSEFHLAEGQRLGHTGSWAFNPSGFFEHWSRELFQIYGLEPQNGAPTLEQYLATIHPQDRDFMAETVKTMCEQGSGCDAKKRIIRPDGAVRYIRCVGIPVLDNGVLKRFLGTAMDVTEQEHLTQELQTREAYLAEAQRLSQTGSWAWSPDKDIIYWSEECYRVLSFDPQDGLPRFEDFFQRLHPDDQPGFSERIQRAIREKAEWEADYRIVHPNGPVRDIHAVAHPVLSTSGDLVEFVGTVIDVTERKAAEERIREQELELRQILDLVPQQVRVYGPGGERLYANRVAFDYYGISLDEWRQTPGNPFLASWFVHPDDQERTARDFDTNRSGASAYESELRVRGADGNYRWFLVRHNPLHDDRGQVKRWYVALTDIDERKRAEEKLQQENVALREEIDKASMFDEIVGTSRSLKAVLSRIAKVAPTDSTVLITGETGTGKELIARAVHKRSQRSGRPFVSVNCAALPPTLVSSELFGHEKGAFTGATQRRLGRFEMADCGTIFLDEVGELLPDTQAALLRVLQEREFERVGGGQPIQINVRVIAATNRDLNAAVANETFRQDLLYRLNVFPIEVPPLRERKDDILMLVEYFVQRYANRAGRNIRSIDQKTLDLLQSYDWPGNIRELQNVIERSIILSTADVFSVDELWLSKKTSPQASRAEMSPALNAEPRSEREVIEAALAETRGRVSGPLGAAAKLGIPPSTLDNRIKVLKIKKNQYKFR
jgi:PAS domain S-box-containing protein